MSDINTNATVDVNINGQQAKNELDALKRRASDLKNAIAKAAKAGEWKEEKSLHLLLNETNRQIRNIQSSAQNVETTLRRLDKASPGELRQTLIILNRQMRNMERGSTAWEAHAEKIREVKKELAEVNQSLNSFSEGSLTDWFAKWQTPITMLTEKLFSNLSLWVEGVIGAYAELDSAMANTQKFTGMSRDKVESLNAEFNRMDTRTPTEGLHELAQAAGRLGKSSVNDVMGFVRAGDIIGVAMDELGSDAPEIISKLAGIFDLEPKMGTEKAMLSVGSTINTLSQTCAAGAPNLVEFASRMGAVASQSKMTMDEMLAFGAVLDANNVTMEKGSTAMQGVITKMYADPAKFAKAAGIDIAQFTEALKRSSTDGIMMFVESLSKMNQMQMSSVLSSLGTAGAGVVQTFQTLAGKTDELKNRLSQSKQAFDDATSATEEYNIQNNTIQARLDKVKKSFDNLTVELGGKLLPVMRFVTSGTAMLIKTISELVNFITKYKGVLITLTTAIIAYNIAANIAVIKTKAIAIWQGIAKTATAAWTVATQAAVVVTALFTRGLHKAKIEFQIFSALIKASPMGLLVGAIAAVVTGFILLTQRTNAAAEAQKSLNKIRDDAQQKIVDEKSNLDLLIAAAKNEKLSLDERKKAIDRLNAIVPNYNAQLDETTGKYTENKIALEEYMKTLARSYELEGAKSLLVRLGKEKAELKTKAMETKKQIEATKALIPKQANLTPRTSGGAYAPSAYHSALWTSGTIQSLENTLKGISHELSVIDAKEKAISAAYGLDLQKSAIRTIETESTDDEPCPKCGKKPCVCNDGGQPERFAAEKAWRERMDLENKLAMRRGLKDYEEYLDDKENIEEQYYVRVLARKDLTESERLKMETELEDARAKQDERAAKQDIELVERTYQEQMRIAKQSYLEGILDAETFKDETVRIELERQRALLLLTKAGSDERTTAEQKYQDALVAEKSRQEAKDKSNQDKKAKADKEITDMRRKYFGLTAKEVSEVEANARKALDDAYNWELTAVGDDAEAIKKIKEQYAAALAAMEKEFADPSWLDKVKGRIGSTPFDGLIEMLLPETMDEDMKTTIMNFASSAYEIYGSVTDMMVAETEIQIAAIERRYEKEISLAEGNANKVKALEKQKERDIAKAKSDANRKQFAMQVIQATAQTAQNAIAAYGSAAAIPLTGHILAPIAAAAAIAAGMLQIAAIKKQQQASESQGYWMGGFTPSGGMYEPAGIVHKGEWVASQKLLASPVARPMIDALDYAQRTNTIGMLKAQDVSRSITAPAVIASSSSGTAVSESITAQSTALADYTSVIRRLNARLDEPFVTINTVTGDAGIKAAQDEYEKLINNKRPKNRKK